MKCSEDGILTLGNYIGTFEEYLNMVSYSPMYKKLEQTVKKLVADKETLMSGGYSEVLCDVLQGNVVYTCQEDDGMLLLTTDSRYVNTEWFDGVLVRDTMTELDIQHDTTVLYAGTDKVQLRVTANGYRRLYIRDMYSLHRVELTVGADMYDRLDVVHVTDDESVTLEELPCIVHIIREDVQCPLAMRDDMYISLDNDYRHTLWQTGGTCRYVTDNVDIYKKCAGLADVSITLSGILRDLRDKVDTYSGRVGELKEGTLKLLCTSMSEADTLEMFAIKARSSHADSSSLIALQGGFYCILNDIYEWLANPYTMKTSRVYSESGKHSK